MLGYNNLLAVLAEEEARLLATLTDLQMRMEVTLRGLRALAVAAARLACPAAADMI